MPARPPRMSTRQASNGPTERQNGDDKANLKRRVSNLSPGALTKKRGSYFRVKDSLPGND